MFLLDLSQTVTCCNSLLHIIFGITDQSHTISLRKLIWNVHFGLRSNPMLRCIWLTMLLVMNWFRGNQANYLTITLPGRVAPSQELLHSEPGYFLWAGLARHNSPPLTPQLNVHDHCSGHSANTFSHATHYTIIENWGSLLLSVAKRSHEINNTPKSIDFLPILSSN